MNVTDPDRMKVFEEVAKECLATESIDFIKAVDEYKNSLKSLLYDSGVRTLPSLNDAATSVYHTYIRAGSTEEVNISSGTRINIDNQLRNITLNSVSPLDLKLISQSLHHDPLHRYTLFDNAHKEIGMMMYQNLYQKFRQKETQIAMLDQKQ